MTHTVLVTGGTLVLYIQLQIAILTNHQASGLLGSQVQKVFDIDGWKSVGTGLTRVSPPEIIKLDILDAGNIEQILDEVK